MMRVVIPPMQIRIPFLKTRVPELASLTEPRRREVLAQCLNDPSMQVLAKRHMVFMRLGGAVLPLALIAYVFLSQTGIEPKIVFWFLVCAMVTAVVVMVSSLLIYHHRSSRQLRRLVQAAVRTNA